MGRRARGKVLAFTRWAPPPGSVVEVRGTLRRPREARNPGEFDNRKLLERKGIYATTYAVDLDGVGRGGGLPALRKYIRKALELNLPELHSGVLEGLVLGERGGIPRWLREDFSRSGTSHILAVSGLHTGFLAGLVFFLLRILTVQRRVSALATVGVLVFYAFLVDLRPSVVRAVILASLVLSGTLVGRDADILNGLGTASLVILALGPRDLADIGFQLSFSAVSGIAVLYGPLHSVLSKVLKGRMLGKISGLMAVSLCAQLGTAPVLAYHFGRLSVVGPLANLAAVPLAGAIVSLGMFSALSYPIWPSVSSILNGANHLFISGLIGTVKLASSLPFSSFRLQSPPPPFLLGYIALLSSAGTGFRPAVRKFLLFSGLVSLNIWAWGGLVGRGDLEVDFLSLGRGRAKLVRFPDGGTVLMGRWSGREWWRVVSPFLRHEGVDGIDLLVPLCDTVPELGRLDVGRIVGRGEMSPGDSLAGLGMLALGGGSFKLSYGGSSALFLGEDYDELDLLRWGDRLRADLLELGRPEVSRRLLRAVRPKVIVLSRGDLGGTPARVLCLSKTGAVSVYAGKGGWRIRTMLSGSSSGGGGG